MSEVTYRRKVIPTAISILWREGQGGAGDSAITAYPLFLQQRAITALHDHFRSSPDQGVLGFLLGNLYECPESGTRYAVIDLVMRLSAQIYADKTTLVVSRVWDKMQEELSKSGGRLLGWYHSHPPAGIELPAGDVETHLQYFADPWQVALVLGADASGPLGGFFRPARDAQRAPAVLPFYEILDPRAVTPEGKKKSSVRWKNYKAHKPPPMQKSQAEGVVKSQVDSFVGSAAPAPDPMSDVVTPQATMAIPRMEMPPPPVARATPPPAPKIEAPPAPKIEPPPQKREARPAPPLAPPPAPPPPPPAPRPSPAPTQTAAMRRARMSRPRTFSIETRSREATSGRGGLLAAIAVLILAGAGAGYWFVLRPRLAARPQPPPAADRAEPPARESAAATAPAAPSQIPVSPPPRAAAPAGGPLARLDQISDTLTRLVGNYQERARMFETRQIDCSGLSRGLVAVESIWIAYNAERRTLTVPLDADRAGRDQTLYTAVDSVESHFDRSRCDRP